MSNPIPDLLALTSIADGSQRLAAPIRNNYSAVQTAINELIAALSGGATGQVLTAVDSSHVQYASPTPGVYRKTTAKQVVNTLVATDLLNGEITLAAGVLATSGVMRLTMWGDWRQFSGASTDIPRFLLKAGAIVLLDSNVTGGLPVGNGSARHSWRCVCEIENLNATNIQNVFMDMRASVNCATPVGQLFATGEGTSSVQGAAATYTIMNCVGWNTGAVDTTLAVPITFDVTLPVASANCDFTLKGALVEVL